MPINFNGLSNKTPIQKFLDSAQSIEFSRNDTVATNVSRSGRLITQTRNTVKPWSFKVKPVDYMPWRDWREEIEQLFIRDRHTEWKIQLGGNSGSAWLSEYMGNSPRDLAILTTQRPLSGITMKSATGNKITIEIDPEIVVPGTTILKSGDILQPAGSVAGGETYRYPYVCVYDVFALEGVVLYEVTLNRGFLDQSGYGTRTTVSNQNVWTFSSTNNQDRIIVGNDCNWRVIVTSMPAVSLQPGKLAQFSGEVQLLEVVK